MSKFDKAGNTAYAAFRSQHFRGNMPSQVAHQSQTLRSETKKKERVIQQGFINEFVSS